MADINSRLAYQRIRNIAEIRKISIRRLAKMAGLKSPSTIYNYQYGKTKPSETSLRTIAKALNTTPEYLKGETDDWHLNTSSRDALSDEDLKEMLDNAHSYDGKPMDAHDREVIGTYLKGYFSGKNN